MVLAWETLCCCCMAEDRAGLVLAGCGQWSQDLPGQRLQSLLVLARPSLACVSYRSRCRNKISQGERLSSWRKRQPALGRNLLEGKLNHGVTGEIVCSVKDGSSTCCQLQSDSSFCSSRKVGSPTGICSNMSVTEVLDHHYMPSELNASIFAIIMIRQRDVSIITVRHYYLTVFEP